MNLLRRICLRQFLRYAETSASNSCPTFFAEPLSKRALIRIQGEEVVPFLQGLITNDMNHLYKDKQPAMFTMFLNNSGRVLYDSIIYRTAADDTYLIECDREVSNELRRHLRLYRVKKNISIDCISADYTPWAVYNPDESGDQPELDEMSNVKSDETVYTADPRVKELGLRVVQPKNHHINDLAKLFPDATLLSSDKYSLLRYKYGVGEGIADHPPGKCFPLEANCDFLHGVSFHKGCYIGQELTARVHHTGVVRKRLMPLQLSSHVEENVSKVQTQAGAVVGTIRSVRDKQALALLRIEQVLNSQKLMVDGDYCHAYRPHWWPKQIPIKQPKIN